MQILKDDDIHLKFLLGLPVHIEGIGNFRSPYLTQVVDMTEEVYSMCLGYMFLTKDQVENKNGLEDYSDFEVLSSFLIGDVTFRTLFFYGLSLHIDTAPTFHPEDENGVVHFGDTVLDEEKFEYIKKLVRIANNLSEQKNEDEFNAGNEQARELIERIKRNRQKNKPKQLINLHSIISAVGWKSKGFKFISDLNLYQLYDGYFRLGYIDNYDHTMTGIYTGNIDGSKIKLVDINWANIIK